MFETTINETLTNWIIGENGIRVALNYIEAFLPCKSEETNSYNVVAYTTSGNNYIIATGFEDIASAEKYINEMMIVKE